MMPAGSAPAISVVMPAYNSGRTIARTVESVLRQTLANLELIVVDDGSRDNTCAVVGEIDDSRIRLLIQPQNLGGNAARNRGIREARAEIISFIDSDDEFLPNKLDTIQRYFDGNPAVGAVIDSFVLRYPQEKGGGTATRNNPVLGSSADVKEGVFNRTVFKATPALSARKKALQAAGMFDETLRRRQDMDMVLRLAKSGEIRTIADVLWVKNWTQGAISAKQGTFMPALLDICERHPEYLTDPLYRRGLSRDFARHFLRLAAKGNFTKVGADWQSFNVSQSRHASAGLFFQGLKEIVRRRRDQAVISDPV